MNKFGDILSDLFIYIAYIGISIWIQYPDIKLGFAIGGGLFFIFSILFKLSKKEE